MSCTFPLNQADRAPEYEPPKLIHVFLCVRLKFWLMYWWNAARSASLNEKKQITKNEVHMHLKRSAQKSRRQM